MEKTHEQGHDAHGGHAEHIHMPSPSLSPIVLAIGISCLVFAIAPTPLPMRITLAVIGALLIAYGLYTWIYDEVRNAEHAEEPAEGARSH